MRDSVCSFSLYLFPFPKHLPASICWTILHVIQICAVLLFHFLPQLFFCKEQKCDTFLLVLISYFPIPCFPPHYPPPLMATVCDLVKSCVLLLLTIHHSVKLSSIFWIILNFPRPYLNMFFRIRYYTLRLAKSDVFTPKLWEAKWIVDEVSCNLKVSMT